MKKNTAPSIDHSAAETGAHRPRRRAFKLPPAVMLAFAILVCLAPSVQMKSRPAADPDSSASSTEVSASSSVRTETPAGGPSLQSQGTTFYFHGTGPNDNPPTLLLDATAPTATTAKFKDSPGINRNNGNPWVEVGTWQAGAGLTLGSLTALGDLHVWLGLKNSDDQGTNFDLRVEAYQNSTLVTSGETLCITGITKNSSSAKEVVLSLASFSGVAFNGTSDVLSLKLLTRVGTTATGASCGGHNNAVGLRLYFDAVSRASRLSASIGSADTTAPVLTVTQPADGSVTNQNSVTVTGTVSDSSPVTVTVNGTSVTVNNGSFSGQISVNEGSNEIRVVATDTSGNQSVVTRTVIRDTTSPTLTVVEPANGTVTRLASVFGTVTDATAVTLTANAVPLALEDGRFAGELILPDGSNQIHIVATDTAGNQREEVRTVTVDTTDPVISNLTPAQGTAINTATTTIQGRVTDATATTVTVNDAPASVGAGGLFTATSISIHEGGNSVVIRAVDAAKNSTTVILLLTGSDRTPPAVPVVFPTVSPTRLAFQTIEGRAEPGSRITITGGATAVTADAAFGTGLFVANVNFATGANNLSVTATDSLGNASPAVQLSITSDPGLAPPPAGQANQINIGTGNAQRGLVATELPRPLIAIVTDRDGNPVQGVSVRFTMMNGGGQLVGGTTTVDSATDAQGHASARYISGTESGIQIVRADFPGNTVTPAVFTSEALQGFPDGATNVTGVVLDQNLRALPNVQVRLGGQQTRTGSDGRFVITNAPSGPHQLLEIIGRDQVTLAGRWPNISYDIDVLPGVDNNLGRPLFLPRVNDGIAMPLDANNMITHDTSYDLPIVGGEPSIRVTARIGTHVTFPPDATDKRLSVTRIATNRVPMALEDGRATSLYISVQPAGAIFDPPLEVSFPNLDQLAAGSQVLLMSFDHDAGRYIRVGTGRVSADGRTVNSEPGSGIRIGAWHGFPSNPPCPEVTVLGTIQIAGNSSFEGKAIVSSEAWVEGTRAVPTTSPEASSSAKRLDYRSNLSVPCGRTVLVKMEATASTVESQIDARYVDHDDPANETSKPLAESDAVYGGSERSTSDRLSLQVSNVTSLPFRNFTWRVSGRAANFYPPPDPGVLQYSWSVGEIKPTSGNLLFQVTVELSDRRRFRLYRNIEVGIRTDDVIVIGWINSAAIPLDTAGVSSLLLNNFPPRQGPGIGATYCGIVTFVDLNNGISQVVPDPPLTGGREPTMAERVYLLNWLFERGSVPDPSTVIPGGDFRDFLGQNISETEVNNFFDVKTGYKAISRFQIKYVVGDDGTFLHHPITLKSKADVGETKNPCISGFPTLASQIGPENGRQFFDVDFMTWINDASPNDAGVRAFNTLMSVHLPPGETPKFWENIGSQIRFSIANGPTGFVLVQPYPTYYVYFNGKLAQVSSEVPPAAHFYTNPYPFGTVPCTRLGTIPGGRCGDASSSREPGSRIPPYIRQP